MRLPESKVPMVLTGALGKYSVEALRDAAISTFPTVGSIRGGPVDGRAAGGYPTQHRKNKFRKEHRAHEVAPAPEEKPEEEQSAESSSAEPGNEPDGFDALPGELQDDLRASSAFMTQAKKRRAEVEKARGSSKKAQTPANVRAG